MWEYGAERRIQGAEVEDGGLQGCSSAPAVVHLSSLSADFCTLQLSTVYAKDHTRLGVVFFFVTSSGCIR